MLDRGNRTVGNSPWRDALPLGVTLTSVFLTVTTPSIGAGAVTDVGEPLFIIVQILFPVEKLQMKEKILEKSYIAGW